MASSATDILKLIYQKGPMNKTMLVQTTQLKLTTLNRLIKPFLDSNFLVVTDYDQPAFGRPSALMDLNRSNYHLIGIDISRAYIRVIITDLSHNIKKSFTQPRPDEISKQTLSNWILQAIQDLYHKLEDLNVLCMGIGYVGKVDVTHKDTLAGLLEATFKVPVYVNSGTNVAVMAEYIFGDSIPVTNLGYVNYGMGIRCSTMVGGHLLEGPLADEHLLSHLVIDPKGPLCACGKKGCLSSYTDQLLNTLESQEDPSMHQTAIHYAVTPLAMALANYIRLFQLDTLIISGPVIHMSNVCYNELTKNLLEYLRQDDLERVHIKRGGRFLDHAIAIGATVYAFEHHLNTFE